MFLWKRSVIFFWRERKGIEERDLDLVVFICFVKYLWFKKVDFVWRVF